MSKGVLSKNKRNSKVFKILSLTAVFIGFIALGIMLVDIFIDGAGRISWDFLSNFPSRRPGRAGILSALVGTLWMMSLTAAFSFPLGLGAGIYLEEYARKNWFTKLVEINISNLAGVPSIIYGLLGLGIFVRVCGFERSLLSGALTLTLLILPIIITTTRESLKAVPKSLREASYALGATQWQTVYSQILPVAMPGILTGTILALSRAIGETAPLIAIGALTYIAFLPHGVFDPFTVLPIQVFNWISRPQHGFAINAAAAIIILLLITLMMNSVAIYLRRKFQRRVKW